jgi:hypothetical protein
VVHTIEINKEDWPEFFQTLNRRAADLPIRLEVEHRDLGDQEMGHLLPLREIFMEEKGSEKGELLITVEGAHGDLTHRINKPVRIYATHNEAAELEVVAIEEGDESRTLIRFEHLPEIPAETNAVF